MQTINDICGSRLPTTSELMQLFATVTRSSTRENTEEKHIALQGQLKKVTELTKPRDEMSVLPLEQNGPESDDIRTPATLTQTIQRPSALTDPMECLYCGEAITQPLRTLDFEGDRPRIISICPFCNEIISTMPRQEKTEIRAGSTV